LTQKARESAETTFLQGGNARRARIDELFDAERLTGIAESVKDFFCFDIPPGGREIDNRKE
jgi:hypothetical protein